MKKRIAILIDASCQFIDTDDIINLYIEGSVEDNFRIRASISVAVVTENICNRETLEDAKRDMMSILTFMKGEDRLHIIEYFREK